MFRIQNILFRFKAKKRNFNFFLAISLCSFSLPFRYFLLHIISFRIQNILFRFEAKQAKLIHFFAISLRSFSLPFRYFSLRSEMLGHPMPTSAEIDIQIYSIVLLACNLTLTGLHAFAQSSKNKQQNSSIDILYCLLFNKFAICTNIQLSPGRNTKWCTFYIQNKKSNVCNFFYIYTIFLENAKTDA